VTPVARYTISRRQLLRLAALLPAGASIAACSGGDDADSSDEERRVGSAGISVEGGQLAATAAPAATATPTATPEPFVLSAGEEQRMLMAGTPYETPYRIYGTGVLGPIVVVLGGVHGNEPGGWLAADRLVDAVRPATGGLLVVPRANRVATELFERTTDEMGDLNRLYPGDPNGLPMAQMAHEIVQTLREFHATHVIDMHESWSFYRDRTDTQTGTAYLGQTLSSRGEPGASLAVHLVETINATRVQAAHEELTFREWPPRDFVLGTTPAGATPDSTPGPGFTGYRGSRSSLGLPMHIPGLAAILVEMGQQQDLERRVQLHVDIVQEALKILGA
jgi:succinylglutamate desuccinylase/aspartoacylase family protein